ncbi:putative porin [Paraburkholderia sp. JPY465]
MCRTHRATARCSSTRRYSTLYGAFATYRLTPSVTVDGGYSFTQASETNHITDPAHYHQISLEQTYNLSARTKLYALEAYQHASGKSLIASGSGVTAADALAVEHDAVVVPVSVRRYGGVAAGVLSGARSERQQ